MADVTCVLESKAILGESPVWSVDEQALYWVDTLSRTLNRFDYASHSNGTWIMPEEIGCCALREAGGLVVGLKSGFFFFDPNANEPSLLHEVEAGQANIRLNDGRCDRNGRFWAGTVRVPPIAEEPVGALFCLDKEHECSRHVEGLLIPNGTAFSPDSSKMYVSDSHPSVQTIWSYDFDVEEGCLSNRQVFATTRELSGRPDGAAVDAEGFYWSANVDGGQVVRFAPDGRVDRIVNMPTSKPSMCAFGGPGLDVVFVTSIRPADAVQKGESMAGGLFAFQAGVKGLPEPKYAG